MGQANFKGVSSYGDNLLSKQLEANLVEWFKYALLGIGAYVNVAAVPTSGAYGGDWSQLRPVLDPNYPSGCVWEGARMDWVWESGLPVSPEPIGISGVWVNGQFRQSGVHIDYPFGRVIFDMPIATTGNVVQAEYSFRVWQVSPANVPWFREVQYDSWRVDDSQFMQYGSGVWSVLAENRVQLPAMVVEVTPKRQVTGYQLGGGTYHRPDVLFHIFAENPDERDKMVDIVTSQSESNWMMFDRNKLAVNNDFPLDPYGSPASGAKTFPQLVGAYPWRWLTFKDFAADSVQSQPPLFQAAVRARLEVIMPPG